MTIAFWHKIRDIHFHPQTGSPFWLERAEKLNIDVFREVNGPQDFWKLGELDLKTLRLTSPDRFLPQNFSQEKMPFESAGSAGEPVMTYFTPQEFHTAFVRPFEQALKRKLFPADGPWLYLGPTGPHAVGYAADLYAQVSCHQRPFMVDFDPRWAKKLPAGSMASQRYLEHICNQALAVIARVDLRVLFVTPPVLDVLSQKMDEEVRNKITGVQLAGMAAEAEQWQKWQSAFPQAQFLIGYGNSLAGVFYPSAENFDYDITSQRIIFSLIPTSGQQRLQHKVLEGELGQIVVHRLDESILYLNLCERDQGKIIRRDDSLFLSEVGPLSTMSNVKKGFY